MSLVTLVDHHLPGSGHLFFRNFGEVSPKFCAKLGRLKSRDRTAPQKNVRNHGLLSLLHSTTGFVHFGISFFGCFLPIWGWHSPTAHQCVKHNKIGRLGWGLH
jgi:hypothetical protein